MVYSMKICTISSKELIIPDIIQYPSTHVYLQKIRDRYLIIPCDEYGVLIVDYCLKVIKEIKISRKIIIGNVYVRDDENEVILNCLDVGGYLIKINLLDFSFKKIIVKRSSAYTLLSPMYHWSGNKIIILAYTRQSLEISLDSEEVKAKAITMVGLKTLDKGFAEFFKYLLKFCPIIEKAPIFMRSLSTILYADFKRYKFYFADEAKKQCYLVDYVSKEKKVLAPYDPEDHMVEYEYGYLITIQEAKIEVFFDGKSIIKLNDPTCRYFGAKIFQDLQYRYLCVLSAKLRPFKGLILSQYTLPDSI